MEETKRTLPTADTQERSVASARPICLLTFSILSTKMAAGAHLNISPTMGSCLLSVGDLLLKKWPTLHLGGQLRTRL